MSVTVDNVVDCCTSDHTVKKLIYKYQCIILKFINLLIIKKYEKFHIKYNCICIISFILLIC